jgi:hypothetical protein
MLPVNRALVKIRAPTNIVLSTETLMMTPIMIGARVSAIYSGVICGGIAGASVPDMIAAAGLSPLVVVKNGLS